MVVIELPQREHLRTRVLRRLERYFPGHRHAIAEAPNTTVPHPDPATYCRQHKIAFVEVSTLEDSTSLYDRRLAPDIAIAAGTGILRAPILALPRLGTLNAHMGSLPFYRGMNVAEWAQLNGDSVGCAVHYVDTGVDTGDILCVRLVDAAPSCIADLRREIDREQMKLLGEVTAYMLSAGVAPPSRAQSASEGRQFFAMHADLRALIEDDLRQNRIVHE